MFEEARKKKTNKTLKDKRVIVEKWLLKDCYQRINNYVEWWKKEWSCAQIAFLSYFRLLTESHIGF